MSRCRVLLSVISFTLLAGPSLSGEPPAPGDASTPAKQSVRTDHYGDPLPPGVRFRLGSVRLRHDGDVTALAWLPDGRTLATAGWDRTVRLWQIPAKPPVKRRVKTHTASAQDSSTPVP
jgi:WD40 repeat protein